MRPATSSLAAEIRPDVVARARALAADPSYPGAGIMKQIAERILASKELTAGDS